MANGLTKDTKKEKKRGYLPQNTGHHSWNSDSIETVSPAQIMGREEMLAMAVQAYTTRVLHWPELSLLKLMSK